LTVDRDGVTHAVERAEVWVCRYSASGSLYDRVEVLARHASTRGGEVRIPLSALPAQDSLTEGSGTVYAVSIADGCELEWIALPGSASGVDSADLPASFRLDDGDLKHIQILDQAGEPVQGARVWAGGEDFSLSPETWPRDLGESGPEGVVSIPVGACSNGLFAYHPRHGVGRLESEAAGNLLPAVVLSHGDAAFDCAVVGSGRRRMVGVELVAEYPGGRSDSENIAIEWQALSREDRVSLPWTGEWRLYPETYCAPRGEPNQVVYVGRASSVEVELGGPALNFVLLDERGRVQRDVRPEAAIIKRRGGVWRPWYEVPVGSYGGRPPTIEPASMDEWLVMYFERDDCSLSASRVRGDGLAVLTSTGFVSGLGRSDPAKLVMKEGRLIDACRLEFRGSGDQPINDWTAHLFEATGEAGDLLVLRGVLEADSSGVVTIGTDLGAGEGQYHVWCQPDAGSLDLPVELKAALTSSSVFRIESPGVGGALVLGRKDGASEAPGLEELWAEGQLADLRLSVQSVSSNGVQDPPLQYGLRRTRGGVYVWDSWLGKSSRAGAITLVQGSWEWRIDDPEGRVNLAGSFDMPPGGTVWLLR